MAVLEELQQSIVGVSDRVGDSVVGIGGRRSLGSGIVIDKGRLLTNAHNLRGEEVAVTLPDGTRVTGTAAGMDNDADLAVVAFEGDGVEPVTWDTGARIEIGLPVFALANPGGRGLRVSLGFVTGTERSFRGPRGRRIGGSLEHTAPLLPGSSGGPVVDAEGRLLGLNTNRLGEGFYLAIPADGALKEQVESLSKGEVRERRRLGVAVAPAYVARRLRRAVGLEEADGVLVRGVLEGSPAEKAGLRLGDLIVQAGGRAIGGIEDIDAAMEAAGDKLSLEVLRGAEKVTLEVPF